MAASEERTIKRDDLVRAIKAVATHFDTDQVIVVGSQALLVGREDIARSLRNSVEIDIYPANAREWETAQAFRIEASEEINAMFGVMSHFHATFGFYIDGVDENTATLPPDWKTRAERLQVDLGTRRVEAVAPNATDLIAAKLARGDPKDMMFASICMRSGLARHDGIKKTLEIIMSEETLSAALGRLRQAALGRTIGDHSEGLSRS